MSEQPHPVKDLRPMPIPARARKSLGVSIRLLLVVPLTVCILAAFLLSLPFSLIDRRRRHS